MPYSNTEGVLISIWCVAAWASWVVAITLVGTAFFIHDPHLGDVGIVTSAGAVALTTKGALVRHRHLMREAFEMGRDSVQRIDRVRR